MKNSKINSIISFSLFNKNFIKISKKLIEKLVEKSKKQDGFQSNISMSL